MKYGMCFLLLSATMLIAAIQGGLWYIAFFYPAISFAIVSIGYFGVGPRVFGKNVNGQRGWLATVLLLPYLLLTLATWHLLRSISREAPINKLDSDFILSRRLIRSELPQSVRSVVDLTCEMSDPLGHGQTECYRCFPILDGNSPSASELISIAGEILSLPKPVLIHCAQGHGRTGLIACAVLIVSGKANNAADAISIVQSVRPGIELNQSQRKELESIE